MKVLALPLAILALVFGLALAGPLREKWQNDNQHAQALQLIEEQRQAYALQQWQTEQAATLPAKIAGQYGLLILLVVGAGGIFYIVYDGYKQRRTPLTRFDPERPLVARWMLEQGNADLILAMMRQLELSGQAQIARANASGNVPHNYAPHISVSTPKSAAPAELPFADAPPPELPAERPALALLPGECTLAALHRTGIVARSGNSLHVGNATADGTPIYMELATWGTLALGGKSRTGKTSRITYFLAQAALNGWRLVVLDKHGGGGKSDALLAKVGMLENSFLLPAAVTQADMKTRIKQVHQIGKRRLDNVDTARYPVVLVIDEFTNLVLNGWLEDESLDQLMSIGNEYAGVNIHSIIIGHDWSASCLGKERGGAFRRTTTHRIAHRLDAAGAQFLLPPGLGKMAEGLTVGQAIYVDDGGEPILVDCPLLHDEDLKFAAEHAGRYLGTFQGAEVGTSKTTPADAPGSGSEVGAEAGAEVATSKHQDATNPRAAMVRQLLREKRTQNEIISQVWGASGGRAYQQAADELREIMAELVGGVL
jgi:hypothetical protein